jgi:hypothetical protein
VLLLAGGCCSPPPPPAAKFFHRETPLETLRGFVYAVDAYQWDYAYESLSESTRKDVGRLKFEVVIRVASVPAAPEIKVYDLISRSIYQVGKTQKSGDDDGARASILVFPDVPREDGPPIYFEALLRFIKEAGEWRFDLNETIQSMQGASPDLTQAARAR